MDPEKNPPQKYCPKCNTDKPEEAFAKNKSATDGLAGWCKECFRSYRVERKTDPHLKALDKDRQLRRDYGISLVEFSRKLAAQDHRCAVCGVPFGDDAVSRPCLDHDHKTQAKRGVLCSKCNTAIGLLGESIDRLEAAAKYLRQWGFAA